MKFSWPTEQEKDVINSIRDVIGRETLWYVVTSVSGCSACNLDPINNSSTDAFCPVCSGLYWIPTYSGISINSHITWGYSEKQDWETGGQLDIGECSVQVEYTQANLDAVDNAKWAVIDGKKMKIINKVLRGVKDINRIIVYFTEKDKE